MIKFKEHIKEGRSILVSPASTKKAMDREAARRKRNPFLKIGNELRANVAAINAKYNK